MNSQEPPVLNLRGFNRLATIAFYIIITVVAGFTAYYNIFSRFAYYDDEGYLMMTVKQFITGDTLYDKIITPYGPCFFVYKWLIHMSSNTTVSHNVVRCSTIAAWLTSTLFCSFFTYRVTRSVALASLTYLLVFRILGAIGNEPGHPQELCAVLLSSVLLLSTFNKPDRDIALSIGAFGFALGALILTKINLGAFLFFSLSLALLAFSRPNLLRLGGTLFLSATTLLLPALLMRAHLTTPSGRNFCLLITISMASTLLVTFYRSQEFSIRFRHYLIVCLSLTATMLLICGIVWLRGTSLSRLLYGIVLQNARFASFSFSPLPVYRFAIICPLAIIGLISSILYVRQQSPKTGDSTFSHLIPLIQLVFGISVVVSIESPRREGIYLRLQLIPLMKLVFGISVVYWVSIESPQGAGEYLLNFATPFLWLALITKGDGAPGFGQSFPRTVLCMVAGLQTLWAYPVPGTQMAFATFLMIPAAVLCIGDAVADLPFNTRFSGVYDDKKLQRIGLLIGSLLILVFVSVLYVQMAHDSYRHYKALVPLELPGADRIRLPEQQVATYNWMARNLTAYSDTFLSAPGVMSLYFWAHKEPPTSLNVQDWINWLSKPQQKMVAENLSHYHRACIIRNVTETQGELSSGKDLASLPLFRYIRNSFKPAGQVGEFEFMVKKGRGLPELIYCARFVRWPATRPIQLLSNGQDQPQGHLPARAQSAILLSLPTASDWRIHRIVIRYVHESDVIFHPHDPNAPSTRPDRDYVLADTQANDDHNRLSILDQHAHPLTFPIKRNDSDTSLNSVWNLLLLPSSDVKTNDRKDLKDLIVRLLDAKGNHIASLPFAH